VSASSRPKIVLSANSQWNIVNFRSGLIRALREAGFEAIVIAPPDASAEQRMRELGVERIGIEVERSGLNPLADLKLLSAYRRLLKQLRPAAYLGYTIKPNIYGCIAAASAGIPAVPNVSGLGTAFMRGGPLRQLAILLYRFAFRRAPVVFFQNEEDRRLFIDLRIVGADRARVVPGSGIDLEHFRQVPLPASDPVFLLIGRLLRDKGVLEFVEAARQVRSELPDARFQLLGPVDDSNRSAVGAAAVRSWVEEGIIEYLGATDDVRPYIAKASVIVLPSYREGLPKSLLEGAAMGRALIAADVPGCRDVVEDGLNGYLCPPRDALSLAGAIRKMAALPKTERVAMGAAGRARIQDRFSETLVIGAYLGALADLGVGRQLF